MHWIWLALAVVLEVCGTLCMKLSHGFSKLLPSVAMIAFYVACFSCFTIAMKRIDISVAYAIWSGLGTALITVVGLMYFREPMTLVKGLSIAFIVVGVVGLNIGGR